MGNHCLKGGQGLSAWKFSDLFVRGCSMSAGEVDDFIRNMSARIEDRVPVDPLAAMDPCRLIS